MDTEMTECFEEGTNGNKYLFLFFFFCCCCCWFHGVFASQSCRWLNNGFSRFLSASPSCLVVIPSATTTLQLYQTHWTKASIRMNQLLGLFVFLILSSLPFLKLPPLPLSLTIFCSLSLPLHLSSSYHGKVVLISGLFIIVGALTG